MRCVIMASHKRPRKCSNAHRYQATKPPKCNGGEMCQYCRDKWAVSPHNPEHTDKERKMRKCLTCRELFLSEWAGNRICARCKEHEAPGGNTTSMSLDGFVCK